MQAGAAVRHQTHGGSQACAEQNGRGIKSHVGQDDRRQGVTQRPVDRVRHVSVAGLQVGDTVMVGVQLPEKRHHVLNPMDAVAQEFIEQRGEHQL